jgi:HD-GYP domain-containing protein (c-di-GMP phosphodiesterase class II)
MNMMESTISRFVSLINSLAGEQDYDKLIERITKETMDISGADGAFTYIVRENTGKLQPGSVQTRAEPIKDILPVYELQSDAKLVALLREDRRVVAPLESIVPGLGPSLGIDPAFARVIAQPLRNRMQEGIGVLCLLYDGRRMAEETDQSGRLAFIEALSGFAAVTLEGRKMLRMQKDLLASFVKLLAGAIDAKSPYTGGHCQRVPILTKLLARKACEAERGPFADFRLSAEEWEALHMASWLHDCGKVTTPEYVVDKATRLETIYNRIHEIRTRFEVLKRDVHIRYWKRIAAGEQREPLDHWLAEEWLRLDQQFLFVAECNLGDGELNRDRMQRLHEIAAQTWERTLDDRIGISWEELQRKERLPAAPLPVEEPLLADRADHLLFRTGDSHEDHEFSMKTPQYLYNRGEIHNLAVVRGTLTEEERFVINEHIVQTILMLKSLPYPHHLKAVPDIAGSHHEKMDGSGYPRGIHGEEMSIPARIVAIADIFEALTAVDRPYKKPKMLSEALIIMKKMADDGHIDRELFHLFLESGAALEYGHTYLPAEQVDEVQTMALIKSITGGGMR